MGGLHMNNDRIAAERRVRTAGLLGDDAMQRLRAASVAVFGLGGVGS